MVSFALDFLFHMHPRLRVMLCRANELDQVCAAIANTDYGLTLGIHSRTDETIQRITDRLHVGNTYVNRKIGRAHV